MQVNRITQVGDQKMFDGKFYVLSSDDESEIYATETTNQS